jgi:hypothetical protein
MALVLDRLTNLVKSFPIARLTAVFSEGIPHPMTRWYLSVIENIICCFASVT